MFVSLSLWGLWCWGAHTVSDMNIFIQNYTSNSILQLICKIMRSPFNWQKQYFNVISTLCFTFWSTTLQHFLFTFIFSFVSHYFFRLASKTTGPKYTRNDVMGVIAPVVSFTGFFSNVYSSFIHLLHIFESILFSY